MNKQIPVAFYIPRDQWPQDIDRDVPTYRWSQNRFGKWNWTLQTYQNLKKAGFKCLVTEDLHAPGILICHRGAIPDDYRPRSDQLLVCILADRTPHPQAHFHILQNPKQEKTFARTMRGRLDGLFIGVTSRYIRYWPQPGLIPRKSERGSRFSNVSFMGVKRSLDHQLSTDGFTKAVAALGMKWNLVHEKGRWNDYSDVDAILAIRDKSVNRGDSKPATKLYNAWIAGIPAILSAESAFQHEGEPGVDYMEANSTEEALNCLKLLRDNTEKRSGMIKAGRKKCSLFTAEKLTNDWIRLIRKDLIPLYESWKALSSVERSMFRFHRRVNWLWYNVKLKLNHRLGLPFNPYK